jgi:hypothetical protein
MVRALCSIVLGAMTLSACSDDDPSGTGAGSGSSNGSTGGAGGAAPSGSSTGNGAGASGPGGSGGAGGGEGGSGGGLSCELPPGTTTEPHVHVVYLVPSDRQVVPLYQATLEKTIRDLQLWYRDHTSDGATFEVHDPVVEIVQTSHPAAFYSTNANGDDSYLWFWNNVLDDAFPATGGTFNDPENVWLYYIDADGACGQIAGGGTSGVAVLPANDLRGLAGEDNLPPCAGDPPDDNPRCRWVGGLGHELGHGFNLPHPPGCDEPDPNTPCDSSALLYLGYVSYPDAHLTEADQATLASSPFFAPRALPDCAIDCSSP